MHVASVSVWSITIAIVISSSIYNIYNNYNNLNVLLFYCSLDY